MPHSGNPLDPSNGKFFADHVGSQNSKQHSQSVHSNSSVFQPKNLEEVVELPQSLKKWSQRINMHHDLCWFSGILTRIFQNTSLIIWLVVLTILKNICQREGLSHILWKIKHVWNHQPVMFHSYGKPGQSQPSRLPAKISPKISPKSHRFFAQHCHWIWAHNMSLTWNVLCHKRGWFPQNWSQCRRTGFGR